MANNIVYTTETPYSTIYGDFVAKHGANFARDGHLLKDLHRKWKSLGKQTKNGLIGLKYYG